MEDTTTTTTPATAATTAAAAVETTTTATDTSNENDVNANSQSELDTTIQPMKIAFTILDGRQFIILVFPSDTIALFYDILSNLPRYCFESRLQFVLDNGTVLEPGTPFAEYDLEANPHVTTRYALYGEPEVRVHVNGLRKILSNHVIDQNKFTNMSVYSRIAHQAVEKDATSDSEFFSEGKLSAFFPPNHQTNQRCLESLEYSNWNPVPSYRVIKGDIAYLVAKTLEGHTIHITACVAGFYCNRTQDDVFDPTPSSRPCMSHSLAGLLGQVSTSFKNNFSPFQGLLKLKKLESGGSGSSAEKEAQPEAEPKQQQQKSQQSEQPKESKESKELKESKESKESKEGQEGQDTQKEEKGQEQGQEQGEQEEQEEEQIPHLSKEQIVNILAAQYDPITDPSRSANIETAPQSSTYAKPFVAPALARHTADAARAESFILGSRAQIDETAYVVNWNEEWQTCRKLPIDQGTRLRDQSLYDLHRRFVEVATQGAKDIIDGKIPPVKVQPNRFQQLYIHLNIFYAFPDSYCDQFSEAGAHAYGSLDIRAVQHLNTFETPLRTLLCTLVDYRGCRLLCQAIIPGVFASNLSEDQKTSTVTYGIVNRDEKAYHWSETMHELARPLAETLNLKEHKVKDKAGETFPFFFSCESHGLESIEGLQYLLDVGRITPMDINFISKEPFAPVDNSRAFSEYTPKGAHESCRLRINLCSYFKEYKKVQEYKRQLRAIAEKRKTTAPKTDSTEETKTDADAPFENEEVVNTITDEEKALLESHIAQVVKDCKFNVDAFTNEGELATEEDKALITEACEFVKQFVARNAISLLNCDSSSSNIITDGEHLTDRLHHEGINIRYLGLLLTEVLSLQVTVPTVKFFAIRLIVTEMVTRVAKRIMRYRLKYTPLYLTSDEVASFLNALFGRSSDPILSFPEDLGLSEVSKSKKNTKSKKSGGKEAHTETTVFLEPFNIVIKPTLPPLENLWELIFTEVETHFKVNLIEIIKKFNETDDKEKASQLNLKPSFALLSEQFGVYFVPFLRSFCSKVGIQIAAREYMDSAPKSTDVLFHSKDIIAVNARVKTIDNPPKSVTTVLDRADNMNELGKSYRTFREGYVTSIEVCGDINELNTRITRHIAINAFQLQHWEAAFQFARLHIITCERVYGIDHYEVMLAYQLMGTFLSESKQYKLAIKFLLRARYIMSIICGLIHPHMEWIDTFISKHYYRLQDFSKSLTFAENSLKIAELHNGIDSWNCVGLYNLIAACRRHLGDYKGSLNMYKAAYDIIIQLVGKEHELARSAQKAVLDSLAILKATTAPLENQSLNGISVMNRADVLYPPKGSASSASSSKSAKAATTTTAAEKSKIPTDIDDLVAFINGKKPKRR